MNRLVNNNYGIIEKIEFWKV